VDQEKQFIQTQPGDDPAGNRKEGERLGLPGQIQTAIRWIFSASLGVTYTGDWNNDDQPYKMEVRGRCTRFPIA